MKTIVFFAWGVPVLPLYVLGGSTIGWFLLWIVRHGYVNRLWEDSEEERPRDDIEFFFLCGAVVSAMSFLACLAFIS